MNDTIKNFYENEYKLSERILNLACDAEKNIKPIFERIDKIAEYNQLKVLKAFRDNKISYSHFGETSGYGYDDIGRDAIDKVFAQAFGAEDALVRHNIVSGTQAISSCLYGILRPNDLLVSVVGTPYDTMEEVIGLRGESGNGSLYDFGVKYKQIDLKDGKVDFEKISSVFSENSVKLALIQRSRGYDWRDSLSVAEIGEIIKKIKSVSPETVCMVDNCYGEFVELSEPVAVGADLIVGSLIKNPGGGLALSGGYVAGKTEYIEKVAYRLTAPGLGRHIGASLGLNRSILQGFFNSPKVVSESLKTAVFCSEIFKRCGFDVSPTPDAERYDIIQAIKLKTPENVIKFCQEIQGYSPIDSYVSPEPWDMPGYENPVIMAAGTFVQGASIELSADAPICPPYIAYMQGGTIFNASKIAILKAADAVIN